jgi:hypothetical protein
LFFYCLADEKDFYDKDIMAIINDGRTRIMRLKRPRKGPGRPLFAYMLSRGAEKAISALSDPPMGRVVVSFEGLRRFCKCEKGGF